MPSKTIVPAKPKAKTKKFVVKKKHEAVAVTTDGPRRLQAPKRTWYKPATWRHLPPMPDYKPLPKARVLFVQSLRQLWQNKALFGGIVVIYGALNLLLVRGFSGSSNLSTLKATLDSIGTGFGGKMMSSAASFTYLLSTSGSGSAASSGVYQTFLLLICSLAFIWALRQVLAKHQVQIRDSFYLGMYPLIPFFLVFMLIGVQLVPLALGGGLYSTVISDGIFIYWWEQGAALVIFLALALWSLRMVTASVFALYISTLPDMTPVRAYRTAKQLVYGRRLLIWRKFIFLPIALLLLAIVVELPLILFLTPVAAWVFFVLSMIALPVVHTYLYGLYREML